MASSTITALETFWPLPVRSEATNVAGMFTWNQLGRRVKKGEKGIQILAPMIGVRRRKQEEIEQDGAGKSAPVLVGFAPSMFSMFRRLKEPSFPHRPQSPARREHTLTGSLTLYSSKASSLNTTNVSRQRWAQATRQDRTLPGQSKAETFATLVHELGHEMLHKADRRTATTKVVRETEAEAIALSWAKPSDSRPATASADYIQLYHGNAACWRKALKLSSAHPPLFSLPWRSLPGRLPSADR